MSDQYVGEIRIFAGSFAPMGWAFCNGQIIPIVQNTALFSLISNMYGGNGTTNFALPNLQGRAVLHAGQEPGRQNYVQGQAGGENSHTLTSAEVPVHNHSFRAAAGGKADSQVVANNSPASTATGVNVYSSAAADTTMHASMLSPAGGGPHENRQPLLTLNFIIALTGYYPTRG